MSNFQVLPRFSTSVLGELAHLDNVLCFAVKPSEENWFVDTKVIHRLFSGYGTIIGSSFVKEQKYYGLMPGDYLVFFHKASFFICLERHVTIVPKQ